MLPDPLLPYRVGGLLYTPALNPGIGEKIRTNAIPGLTSVALCLEDAVEDEALSDAERELCRTLRLLEDCERLPLLFVRVRSPQHLAKIHRMLGSSAELLCGYVLPKFDLGNAERYLELLDGLNARSAAPVWCMPILESGMVANITHRRENLAQIKSVLDADRSRILNVRVGGNDFCNLFGIRRHADQTIYDVGVIRDILSDIVNVFGSDYVVSGPVWDYFGADPDGLWAQGLRREMELDLVNGFIGKTAIHPSQLPVIADCLRVRRSDYNDAAQILDWKPDGMGVRKSADGARMNERKCHVRWAKKTIALAEVFGVAEESGSV